MKWSGGEFRLKKVFAIVTLCSLPMSVSFLYLNYIFCIGEPNGCTVDEVHYEHIIDEDYFKVIVVIGFAK